MRSPSAMRLLRILPVAALLLAAPSCTFLKNSGRAVVRGSQATWNAVAGAGSSVVEGTASLGKKTARAAGSLIPGHAEDDAGLVELTLSWSGRRGIILIAPDDEAAPQHARNFRKLAKENYYKNILVHRSVANYLIQSGDPRTRNKDARPIWGLGGPGYTLPSEIKLRHHRGSVAMARLGDRLNPTRQSNGSQFYICLKDLKDLDGQYTVFGHVVAGLEVADAISNLATDENDIPETEVRIEGSRLVLDQAPVVAATPTPAPAPAPAAKPGKGKTPPPPVAPAPPPPAKKKGWFGRLMNRIW